ncbi:uncharacterized protein LOC112540522 isoform X2 [Python bivittatus]|uniref:Uncharacterized protein LOC112540522 isoform X2 n=1 Tax=Python bivittatus TaxID=176946 RepID=A0A9F5IW40_PYTBI|nr:uncharacterized protein LOC112540522 isoform X2 [Python bivittatus]
MQRLMNCFSVLAKNDWKTTFILWSSSAASAHCLPCMRRSLHNGDFNIHPFVKEAMESRKPIVALESTIVTHGMPYPQNLSLAREVEEIVRANGCVPATIGILNGCIHVGLQDEELEILATAKNVMKVSRRDFPYVLSQGLSGGTTVAGTMIVAHRARIPVFVTGGIGGVHRGGEKTLDVSADLTELSRTPVAVISAGVKSILDIGRTLEYLETQGVCVATFGKSREFPAFFSHQSGFQAPYQVQDEKAAAQLIDVALIKNNARVGSRIAVALNSLQRNQGWRGSLLQNENTPIVPRPVVIGGINIDIIAKARAATIKDGGQTNPSTVRQSFGGVGKNLADCLSRLGKIPVFISVMGKDEHSESVLRHCRHMDMRGVLQLKGRNTATYCAVITGNGELTFGLGDMDIHQQITEQYVSQFKENLCLAPIICIDGNVPVSTIEYICQIAREHHLTVYYEPTDVNKASKPFISESWRGLTCISPNLWELRAISQTLGNPVPTDLPSKLEDIIETAIALAYPLLNGLHYVVVTLGQHGVLLCGRSKGGSVSLHPQTCYENPAEELRAVHYAAVPVPIEEIVNVSGAGDSLMAGIIAGLLAGEDTENCIRMGLLSASLSLRSHEPVSPEINSTSVSLYSCPGIQLKACRKPSDCDGCLGLYTCKLPKGRCDFKAVSRQTGGFSRSIQER